MQRKFKVDDPRVVSIVREHGSTRRKVLALRKAVESKGIVLLVGPYATGKTPIAKDSFPGATLIEPYFPDHAEWLVRASRGKERVGETVIIDELYPLTRLNPLKIVGELSRRTRLILILHPQVLDETNERNERNARIREMLNELDVPIVKNSFWPDELTEIVCREAFGFSSEEAREFARFSGGLPTIMEAEDQNLGSKRIIEMELIMHFWQKQICPMSEETIRLLHTLSRTGVEIPKLEFLRDFGYFSPDGTKRALSLSAYFAVSTGDGARVEEIKEKMQHFELQ